MPLDDKVRRLQEILLGYTRVAVAFSGGVDSSLLLKTALDTLGAGNVQAFFACSLLVSEREQERALSWPSRHQYGEGVKIRALDLYPLTWKEFVRNPDDRCYLCKLRIYSRFREEMEKQGIFILADGTHADDLKDRRSGLRAIHELGVRMPLVEAGFGKDEVRARSRELHLDTWQQPSSSCLATRIPTGLAVTAARLRQVALREKALVRLGFSGCRVRLDPLHADRVHIQVQQKDMEQLLDEAMRVAVIRFFQKDGVRHVYLDLQGR